MKKVYAYQNIDSLDQYEFFNEISKYPFITATIGLKRNLEKRYESTISKIEYIEMIQSKICSDWNSNNTVFEQYIDICKVIHELRYKNSEKEIYRSFYKNRKNVLNSIRSLVEADIYPWQLNPANKEELLFKNIWEKLEASNNSFGQLRFLFASCDKEPNRFIDILKKYNSILTHHNKLVLVGFYFTRPLQERIFDLFEKNGFDLIFLSHTESNYQEVGSIWYESFTEENGFPARKKWIYEGTDDLFSNSFASVFEPKSQLTNPTEGIKIIRYNTEMDFVVDLKRIFEENTKVFTTNRELSNQIIKEYYPEKYSQRHLLSYPVGQYIYRLHKMWDSYDQKLNITFEDVYGCFASGWLEKDGINGRIYTADLKLLETYLSNCKTVDEWETQLQKLEFAKATILSAFESHLNNVPTENKEKHKFMGNPFLNFSCFSVQSDKIDSIIMLLRHLISTAKSLFFEKGTINIKDHFNTLNTLISESRFEKELFDEERAILKEIQERLSIANLSVKECLPDDISSAIIMILGDGILDSDIPTDEDTFEEDAVSGLYEVESSLLLEEQKVHLCFADEKLLPGSIQPFTWPLTSNMLDSLILPVESRSRQYLKDLRFVIEKSPVANRYLFYTLLKNKDVEISWIQNQDNTQIAPSPYVQLLELLYGIKISEYKKNSITTEEVHNLIGLKKDNSFSIKSSDLVTQEETLDFALCPWRYIYGYLLNTYPSYESEFHYSFLLSSILSVLSKISGYSIKIIAENLYELFPYLTNIEKQQIKDHAPSLERISEKTDDLDNASYPEARLWIHFLLEKIWKEADEANKNLNNSTSKNETKLQSANNPLICQYCPHVQTCPHTSVLGSEV